MPGKKSAYVKGARKNKPKGGLNKTEKKQTKKIVAAAIKKEHVLKYFNSNSYDNGQAPQTSNATNAKQEVSVIAFSSTTEFGLTSAQGQVAVKYGQQDYKPLYLSRPFKENNNSEALAAQALNGQYCLPKTARSCFSIERVRYVVPSIHNNDANPTPTLAHSLPISYRIIKVGFKASAGTQNDFDPNTDLFVDSFGQPWGIDSLGFTRLNCKYAPINTKKYTKLMDIQGTLNQNMIATPNQVDVNYTSDIVTSMSGKNNMHLTIPFKLSKRKGGKLFYEEPQQAGTTPITSDSGGQRELLLMHYWFDNGHNSLGGAGQPEAPTSSDIQIKVKSTSAFVDAQ
jgi:hypothetical protein